MTLTRNRPFFSTIYKPGRKRFIELCSAFVVTVILVMAISVKAQAPNGLAGFAGTWQINLGETKQNRLGPDAKYNARNPAFSYVYSIRGNDLKWDLFETGLDKPMTRSLTIITDGKQHVCDKDCTGFAMTAPSQTVVSDEYVRIDDHSFVRLRRTNGKKTEYFLTSLSVDGKTMTHILWSPETPQWQNVYVYDRKQ